MTQHERTTDPRVPLNRERILRAAIDLADRDGIDALSMRRLGRELGVEAMSLYRYVASKEDLLDGVADIVVAEIELPRPGAPWKDAMRRRAVSVRTVVGRHPWAAVLIDTRTTPSPIRMRYADAVVGCLRGAGFTSRTAIHAFLALDAYIYGFALQERSLPGGTPEELAGAGEDIRRDLPADEFPHLAETVETFLAADFSYEDEFAWGLDVLLDGLERAKDASA